MKTSNQILKIISENRRISGDSGNKNGFSLTIMKQVRSFVEQGKPIRFALPGFPCKSTSRDKTLSNHADMAEELSIKHLLRFLDKIKSVYPKGATLDIHSDGGVFCGKIHDSYTITDRHAYTNSISNQNQ